MNATNRYARAQNETASPERLMVLLFETALRHIRAGAAALEAGQAARANLPLSKAADIVVYLHATFDARLAPKLAEHLGVTYRFVSQRLISANLRNDARLARDAEKVFFPVADAFVQAVAQLQTARGVAR